VTFIVTSKGKISTPKIKKSLHPLLDLEAIRLVSNMPDWQPGQQDGKPIDVQVMVPIDFKLP
jgi:Gram-negative bacterial tonB protein.